MWTRLVLWGLSFVGFALLGISAASADAPQRSALSSSVWAQPYSLPLAPEPSATPTPEPTPEPSSSGPTPSSSSSLDSGAGSAEPVQPSEDGLAAMAEAEPGAETVVSLSNEDRSFLLAGLALLVALSAARTIHAFGSDG